MYSGAIAAADAPGLLAQQALWIILLVPLGRLALRRAISSAQAAGG